MEGRMLVNGDFVDDCAMRTCPVCGAQCFGDMDVCYSCLHDFGMREPVSPDAFMFGAASESLDGEADGGFVPEEAADPAGLFVSPVSALVEADAQDAGGPAQLRIVIDFRGLGAICSQKS